MWYFVATIIFSLALKKYTFPDMTKRITILIALIIGVTSLAEAQSWRKLRN